MGKRDTVHQKKPDNETNQTNFEHDHSLLSIMEYFQVKIKTIIHDKYFFKIALNDYILMDFFPYCFIEYGKL